VVAGARDGDYIPRHPAARRAAQGTPMPASPALAVRVRRAQPSDLDELVALEQASFDGDRLSRAQYRRHLDSDSALVLAAVDAPHRLLGAAVLFFRKGSGAARLYSLASDPAARGRGVGGALLEAAEAAARRRRCRAMRLEVRADNAAAIRLYERHGYRRLSRLEGFYEDGTDGWKYAREL
jgi:ribosomal protein S18 acetylase RimI-like enzyme